MISDVVARHVKEIGIIRQRDNGAFETDEYGESVRTETVEETILAHIQSPTSSDFQNLPEGESSTEAIVAYSEEKMRHKDILIVDNNEYTVQPNRKFKDNSTKVYRAVALWKSERRIENDEPN